MPTAGPVGEVGQRAVGDDELDARRRASVRSASRASASRIAFCRPWIGSSGRLPSTDRPSNRSAAAADRRARGRSAVAGRRRRRARARRRPRRSAADASTTHSRRPTSPARAGASTLAVLGEQPRVDPPHAVDEARSTGAPRAGASGWAPTSPTVSTVEIETDRRAELGLELDRTAVLRIPGVDAQLHVGGVVARSAGTLTRPGDKAPASGRARRLNRVFYAFTQSTSRQTHLRPRPYPATCDSDMARMHPRTLYPADVKSHGEAKVFDAPPRRTRRRLGGVPLGQLGPPRQARRLRRRRDRLRPRPPARGDRRPRGQGRGHRVPLRGVVAPGRRRHGADGGPVPAGPRPPLRPPAARPPRGLARRAVRRPPRRHGPEPPARARRAARVDPRPPRRRGHRGGGAARARLPPRPGRRPGRAGRERCRQAP